jgi:hypothetical protein
MEFGTAAQFEKLLASPQTSMAQGPTKTKFRIVHGDGASSELSTIGLEKIDGAWKVNW